MRALLLDTYRRGPSALPLLSPPAIQYECEGDFHMYQQRRFPALYVAHHLLREGMCHGGYSKGTCIAQEVTFWW